MSEAQIALSQAMDQGIVGAIWIIVFSVMIWLALVDFYGKKQEREDAKNKARSQQPSPYSEDLK